jgi:tetratricopeptide (TPR) repeat protein
VSGARVRALFTLRCLWIWLPLGLAALASLNTLGAGFVWDDSHLIVTNTLVRQASPLPALATDFWQEGERSGFYRPLVSLSYFMEFRLWRLRPGGYHAANLAYHLGAVLAVTLAARALFPGLVAAAVAGIVFGVHPIHTESVAFISGRPDLFAGALLVGAFALYVRGRRRGRQSAGSVGLFAAALLSKEVALAFPLLLLAYETTIGDRAARDAAPSPPRLGRTLAPYLAVAAGYFCLRWLVLGAPFAWGLDHTGFGRRALVALNASGEYLRLLAVPWPPAPDRVADGTVSAWTVASLAALMVLVLGAAWSWRASRVPAFLLAWFLLTLLPASPLVPGRAPQVAERFLYIPSVAWAWLLGWAIGAAREAGWLASAAARRAAVAAGAVAVVAAVGLTAARNRDWRDESHLFRRMAASEPRSYLAPLNLGYLYVRAGDLPRAEAELQRALALRPQSPPALLGLALVESRRGDHDGAIRYAERARDLAPDRDSIHAQLGAIYGTAGRYAEAAASFRESVRRNPRRLESRANLAVALADAGRATEAAEALAEAERVLAAEGVRDPAELRMLAQVRERLFPEPSATRGGGPAARRRPEADMTRRAR